MASFSRDLESAVFDEGRTFTYLEFAREKGVPAEDAKRVLADFAGKHGDSVHVIHLITGYASGSLTMQLADGKSFEGVLRSLADGAASHVYSVGAKRSVDPAAKLYSAVASQAATLCNETSPRGEAYRRNKSAAVPCAVVDHTPNTAAAAGRSVTVGAPKASEPAVASAPPTLRKAASAVEGGDVTAPSVAPPKPPPASSSAGAPDRAGAAKKVPAKPAKTSSFFGGFAAQVAAGKSALEKVQAASPVASLPSSPPPASEAPPAPVAAPKDSGSDSDDAEFGAGLVPSKPSNSTSASKPAALASKIKSTVTPPAKAQPPAKAPAPVAMSDEEEEEEEEMDVPPEADLLPSVDLNASVEPQAEVAVADPVSSAPVVPGKTMKKVLKERTFENEDGFLVTEHVWEEVEVDDVAPAAPTAVLANHASPKPKMMTTPAPKAAPASAPSSDTPAAKKTPAGGTKRKAKEPVGGPKQSTMTSFFGKK